MGGMSLYEGLTTTRAVRKRLDLERPVDRDVVERCLRTAFQAPNGSNGQLWSWVLVDDPDVRKEMATIYAAAMDDYASRPGEREVDYSTPAAQRIGSSVYHLRQHLHEVPVLVVPLIKGRMDGASIFDQASRWGSVLPAVWNFMLALRNEGMGSAWTTIHLHHERAMADALGVPFDQWTQAGLFPVAYTIGTTFKLADRAASDDLVSWNRFGG